MQWFVLNTDFIGGGPLWYLTALLVCYFVLSVYIRWNGKDYRYFYAFALAMPALEVILDAFAKTVLMTLPEALFQNGLLLGLPMFALGLFLKDHQQRLSAVFSLTDGRLWLLLGALVQVFSLMLLLSVCPPLAKEGSLPARAISYFGSLSTFVYITHLICRDVYLLFFQEAAQARFAGAEPWLYPLAVTAMALSLGIGWEFIKWLASRRRSRRSDNGCGLILRNKK